MTIGEAITASQHRFGAVVPAAVLVQWLSHLDGAMHREILETHYMADDTFFTPYDENTSLSTPLMVPFPYDTMYVPYLEMKTAEVLGETLLCNNAAAQYHNALLTYMDAVNRSCLPKGAGTLKLF